MDEDFEMPPVGGMNDDDDMDVGDSSSFLKVGEEKEIQQGLKKKLLKEGEGFETPENGDEVEVHYTGTLLDGTKFDSSRDRGTPFKFTLGQAYAKKSADVTELQIGVKFKPQKCDIQAHKGDKIKVHYQGKLTDGTVFDSSFERGDPIEFELGTGQVIPGWDQGLLGACVGEKRKLKIPSKLGYGDNGSPPKIPGGATLIFDTELVAVNGKTSGEGKTKNEL